MPTSKGFIGLGVLIAIVLGLIVIGGGAYFVMRQPASPQTSPETPLAPSADTVPQAAARNCPVNAQMQNFFRDTAEHITAIKDIVIGTGATATKTSHVVVMISSRSLDGYPIDTNAANSKVVLDLNCDTYIEQGVIGMKEGGVRDITYVPGKDGYGSAGFNFRDANGHVTVIPPGSTLIDRVSLIKLTNLSALYEVPKSEMPALLQQYQNL